MIIIRLQSCWRQLADKKKILSDYTCFLCVLHKEGSKCVMIISPELAQKIVDNAMCLVHRNVNIMNREGIIIATGHPHRMNTFHKGARDVIETGAVIEIFPGELALYPGALQGVNLPIVMDEQVVGVVGVFGHPDEVRDTGRLVKMITELILERDVIQRDIRSKLRLREQLIDMAVTNAAGEISPKLRRTASALGLDLSVPRAVVLVDVAPLITKLKEEYGPSEFVTERAEDSVIERFGNSDLVAEQDIAVILDKRLVILKACSQDFHEERLLQWTEKMSTFLDPDFPHKCGIGAVANSAVEYNASFKQALFCLAHTNTAKRTGCIYEREVLVRYASREALTNSTKLALAGVAKRFGAAVKDNPEFRRTIEALLENNLDINATADRLHVHRNTLLYRLSRFEVVTGLDPHHKIDDVILCRLLLNSLES